MGHGFCRRRAPSPTTFRRSSAPAEARCRSVGRRPRKDPTTRFKRPREAFAIERRAANTDTGMKRSDAADWKNSKDIEKIGGRLTKSRTLSGRRSRELSAYPKISINKGPLNNLGSDWRSCNSSRDGLPGLASCARRHRMPSDIR
jgi:hypothetical protein